MAKERIVVWFSQGVTSAVAALLAKKKYADYDVLLVSCDTGAEDPDNWRFASDVSRWLNTPLTILKNEEYANPDEVYARRKYLVGPRGAPCTMELKKRLRLRFQNLRTDIQIFGFDARERGRAKRFVEDNPEVTAEFPLLDEGLTKGECRQILLNAGIVEPASYAEGFKNANCLMSGCVKGGAGYWNFIRRARPDVFARRAKLERELNASMLTRTGKDGVERIFLDELPPEMGNYKLEPAIQCGLFCGAY